MSLTCPRQLCPACQHPLIHQDRRQPHESSSRFGQFVHDSYERDFYAADLDLVIFKERTRILRVFEHKQLGGMVSPGQGTILRLLASGLTPLVDEHQIDSESGVFVVRCDLAAVAGVRPPCIEVTRIGSPKSPGELRGGVMDRFLTGRHVETTEVPW